MKHSEVLNRYVNTGIRIPEEQFDRLSPSLKKSYLRMRGVDGNYFEWELSYLTDDEKIKIIEKKGKWLKGNEIHYLLNHSKNKDLIATKIIDVMGGKLSTWDISDLLKYSNDKDLIATKIIDIMGEELYSDDIGCLLRYSEDKELINKLLLQIGFNYKKINKIINRLNIDTPLIPDNYQSMLNEIKRIKEIMK
jgi:hypothetical protein